ncbi:hypothetical protein [Cyclobacterium sp.]|nr:hypothetical protein [Cyclobacterium sp.]MBD3630495.1 hypothetical protein [Cyclobacterium sp.]
MLFLPGGIALSTFSYSGPSSGDGKGGASGSGTARGAQAVALASDPE